MGTIGQTLGLTYDTVIQTIAEYVSNFEVDSDAAYDTARLCLADSIGCALLALRFPACTKLLGPLVPGTCVPFGCRVPGTSWTLDPVRGAFNIGTMVRWLDYNDTWLAAEWGHPSDNLGGILAVSDHLSRQGESSLTMQDVLTAMIKAHEIQGVLALKNSFNRMGLDHVLLVRIATTAVVTGLLKGSSEQIFAAISNAWVDGGSLRCYRHYPNTGSRKSWAAGDATSRGVQLAYMALTGEMGYPTALSAPRWGFQDVLFGSHPIVLERPLGSYVMEHVLFKIQFPAEFHAQTAVECAVILHPKIKHRLADIASIDLITHESAMRIIDKKGPLSNPADRDHCLQYMVAIGLIHGDLTADHYEDEHAAHPLVDALRDKMTTRENPSFTQDYMDASKRSIANTVEIRFKDGSCETATVEYPIGHRRRRSEAVPLLFQKFIENVSDQLPGPRVQELLRLFESNEQLLKMPVKDFMSLLVL